MEQLLTKLAADPATVVELYPALGKQSYWVLLLPKNNGNPQCFEFLTYPSSGNVSELPAFTSDTFPLFDQLKRQTSAHAELVDGLSLFERLKSVIETGKTELAINPGWRYGIRLNRSMLLSAIAVCGRSLQHD